MKQNIVKKHHHKNLYVEFHKPVGTYNLLDLDLQSITTA